MYLQLFPHLSHLKGGGFCLTSMCIIYCVEEVLYKMNAHSLPFAHDFRLSFYVCCHLTNNN